MEFGDLVKPTDLTLYLISLDTSIGNNINNVNPHGCQDKVSPVGRSAILNFKLSRIRSRIDQLSESRMTRMAALVPESHPVGATGISPAAKAVCPDVLRTVFIVLGLYVLLTAAAEAVAKEPLFDARKVIIALDPGHGGSDLGAVGPDGTAEKTVTLILAQMIASELAAEYTVVFSRLDDYQVEIEKRAAVANHQKADLFISIHTGGSFVQTTTGSTLFYYQHDSNPLLSRMESGPPPALDPLAPIPWDLAQDLHLEDSQILAKMTKAQIDNLNPMKPCRLQGAPLAVLKGANMPAIAIEVGYLTNPAEEKNLRDSNYLLQFARAITKGVRDFLAQRQR